MEDSQAMGSDSDCKKAQEVLEVVDSQEDREHDSGLAESQDAASLPSQGIAKKGTMCWEDWAPEPSADHLAGGNNGDRRGTSDPGEQPNDPFKMKVKTDMSLKEGEKAKNIKNSCSQRKFHVIRSENVSADVMEKNSIKMGPASVEELLDWPQRLCHDLFGTEHSFSEMEWRWADNARFRAEKNLQSGLVLHTDYTGQMCAETAVKMTVKAMRITGSLRLHDDNVIIHAGCDCSPLCQSLMKSMECDQHIFEDVAVHVDAEARSQLERLRPPAYQEPAATPEEAERRKKEASESYGAQFRYLRDNRHKIFDEKKAFRTAYCLRHDDQCPTVWRPPLFDVEGVKKSKEYPLMWNMSGPMCVPYATFGKRLQEADPSMEPWHIWSHAMAASNYDLVTAENSDDMPPIFDEVMTHGSLSKPGDGAKWFVITLVLNSTDYGWPARRRRSWRTALNMDTMIWMGPRSHNDIMKHFNHFLRRSLELSADCFLVTPEAERTKHMEELARAQGNYAQSGRPLEMKQCLSRSSHALWKKAEDKYTQMTNMLAMLDPNVVPDCFVADFSQDIDKRDRSGSVLPALQRSSHIYSYTSNT